MACLDIRGLTVFGRHGVLPEETRLGQRFVVDMAVDVDVGKAVATDDYAHAVCYASLSGMVAGIVGGEPFALIETLADRIATRVLEKFASVRHVKVTVHKPGAPIPQAFEDVSVTVALRRMLPVAFSLGSNMGEREGNLRAALTWLGTEPELEIEAVSGFYDSAPWGNLDQPGFVNVCAVGRTSLAPHMLLRVCKDIEMRLGRMPGVHWGPRNVDVDVLYMGDIRMSDPVLTLPHPYMAERAFVLEPLAEIAPEHRIGSRTVCDMLKDVTRVPGDVTARAQGHGGK